MCVCDSDPSNWALFGMNIIDSNYASFSCDVLDAAAQTHTHTTEPEIAATNSTGSFLDLNWELIAGRLPEKFVVCSVCQTDRQTAVMRLIRT